ncbi:MAG: thioredoxin TrxC [Sulfuricellaceae bacterium]|nr:thioredoxin TrxC [Sulfuricellaceae bacterium]
MNIVCPACQAINRVPDERLAQEPKCGKCGSPLLQGKPLELNGASFPRFVAKNDLPVVVDFWAPWCGPCKMMGPVFAQVASELKTRFIFVKVNTEVEQGVAQQFGIRSIPTLAIFKNGSEVNRVAGAMDASGLKNWLLSQKID